MNPALAAGLFQAGGSLLGGLSRNKAAKKLKKSIDTTMKRARVEIEADQNRALEYRGYDQADVAALTRADEARLRDATGYDFAKLREDAVSAGFNPLTVLQATGGAGYDGRSAVLSTPFIDRPFMGFSDVTTRQAELQAGVGGSLVDTAGYFGDSLAAGAAAFFDQRNAEIGFELDRVRNSIYASDVARQPMGSPFGSPVVTRDAAPKAAPGLEFLGPGNPFEEIHVYDPQRFPFMMNKSWADRNGFKEGDQLAPGDFEIYMGESGQAASAATSPGMYDQLLKSPLESGPLNTSPGWSSPTGAVSGLTDWFFRRFTGESVADRFRAIGW